MPTSALPHARTGLPIAAREAWPAADCNRAGPIELMGARMTSANISVSRSRPCRGP